MTIGTWQSEIETSLFSAFLHNRCSTLWPPCGFIERLDVGGLPLGIQADARYESASVVLAPGDWLVIFTDGLEEAVNVRDEEYAEPRLLHAIDAGTSGRPSDMLKRLMAELDLFVANTIQRDDVTCMLRKAEPC